MLVSLDEDELRRFAWVCVWSAHAHILGHTHTHVLMHTHTHTHTHARTHEDR